MSTETLHFTIGEGAGIIITNIAQEHLLYNYDPIKAVNMITQSLIGCSEDLALQILNGDIVLPVDEDTQQIICVDREEGTHDLGYPKLNIASWCERNSKEIKKAGTELKDGMKLAKFKVKNGMNSVDKTFDYSTILKFVAGNDKAILDELQDIEIVDEAVMLVNTIRKYIEKSVKIQNVIDWSRKTYPQEFIIPFEHQTILIEVMNDFKELISDEIEMIEVDSSLTNYMSAVRTNDEIIKVGIVPVDIMDNYSAGWLSPDGKYYGLNGEIANMLHIQIGDALQEKGIVPNEEDKYGNKPNPDSWLEQQGWVKIHGNNVQFGGCLNSKIGKENVDITQKQIDVICDYIENCHACLVKVGWRLEKQNVMMFKIASMNLSTLYKRFFTFD